MRMKFDTLDKFKGAILGGAIGDTLGQPFEGQTRRHILTQFSNFEQLIIKKKKLFSTYTDDTQLTLHVAQALINGDGFNIKKLVRELIKWLDDPPIKPGYGTIRSVQRLKLGVPWEQAASNSGGNGAIMRSIPLALFYNESPIELKNAIIKATKLTHNHPAAEYGSVIIGRAIAFLVNVNPKNGFSTKDFIDGLIKSIQYAQNEFADEFVNLIKDVEKNLDLPVESGLIKYSQSGVKTPYFIEEYMGKAFVHPYSMSTVACSLFLFMKFKSTFQECIQELITSGGDTDTVGAIGGALVGAYAGFDGIPKKLANMVKNEKDILQTAELLHDKYKQYY